MVLPTGWVSVGPGFTTISYVFVEGQPSSVDVMVKVTVLEVLLALVMVKAGIEFAFPDEGFTDTSGGIVVASQEKVVPA